MKNKDIIELLKKLIQTPSFSREEEKTGNILTDFFKQKNISVQRIKNNIIARNKFHNAALPSILLNSHHDTVQPNKGYINDPFKAIEKDGKLFGLGSNDAGGALVSLIATFLYFHDKQNLKYNLILAATAEEEISGKNGIESILPELGEINFAIVGEPTEMNLAIAAKGLMVIDCLAKGKSGHAARDEGENAIYKALKDIEWVKDYQFPKISETLGKVKMSVTLIESGTQHNVIPDTCQFTIDVRTTDIYTNEEVLAIIKQNISSEISARSTRLNSSSISIGHPFVQAGIKIGRKTFSSPTLSDQALMPFPSVKIGPGKSERSHIADEYIELKEIEEGIDLYIKMLEQILI